MNKIFIIIIFFSLCFISPSQADDIKNFQIDGITVGDSLLDHYSKEEINAGLKKTNSSYTSKRFIRNTLRTKGNNIYNHIGVHYKNDGSYEIGQVAGLIFYRNNIDECYSKQKEVANEIASLFPSSKKKHNKFKYSRDEKSTFDQISYKLKSGDIIILCRDWSKKIEKKWVDNLSIQIRTSEYIDWLRYEANK